MIANAQTPWTWPEVVFWGIFYICLAAIVIYAIKRGVL